MFAQALLCLLVVQLHYGESGQAEWSQVAPVDFPVSAALQVKEFRDAIICSIAASSAIPCRLFCFNSSSLSCSFYEFPVIKQPYTCKVNCELNSRVCYQQPVPPGFFIGNGNTTFTLLTAASGNLSVLNIYNLPMIYIWRWKLPSSHVLDLNFEFIDLGGCGCPCSLLQVRDVNTSAIIDGNEFCGAYQSLSITVHVSEVELYFTTDGSAVLPGFQLDYKCYHVYKCDTPLTVLTQETGEIHVLDVPAKTSNCTWRLQAPQGKLLKLSFAHFNLGACCDCASLSLYDPDFPYFALTGDRLCGTSVPEAIPATVSNNLDVTLTSDGTSVVPGFKILYGTILKPTVYYCDGNQVLTAVPSIIRVNVSNHYSLNLNCSWRIQVAPGRRIAIFTDWFQTEDGYDMVKIEDISTQSSLGPNPMTGRIQVPLITSTGNEVLIDFFSDHTIPDFGFHFYYYVV